MFTVENINYYTHFFFIQSPSPTASPAASLTAPSSEVQRLAVTHSCSLTCTVTHYTRHLKQHKGLWVTLPVWCGGGEGGELAIDKSCTKSTLLDKAFDVSRGCWEGIMRRQDGDIKNILTWPSERRRDRRVQCNYLKFFYSHVHVCLEFKLLIIKGKPHTNSMSSDFQKVTGIK